MQPRQTRPDIPYFNRRDQHRMLALVGLLCLVMIATQLAARPESWYWLVPPSGEALAPSNTATLPRLEELDFHVRNNARRLQPADVLLATVADDEDPPERTQEADSSMPVPAVEVPEAILNGIEDNTVGVQRSEVGAYYDMLSRIRALPEVAVAKHARDDIAFTVLMLHSDTYRGQLVTVTGELHRLTPFPVAEGAPDDIRQLYEGWLTTPDSGNNPYRFLSTEVPAGVVPGESIEPVRIEVTGYFFKRYGYASRGGMHVAPTLLAKSFRVLTPTHRPPAGSDDLSRMVLTFFALIVGALLIVCWQTFRSARRYEGSRLKDLASSRLDAEPDDLKALENLETTAPLDFRTDERPESAAP